MASNVATWATYSIAASMEGRPGRPFDEAMLINNEGAARPPATAPQPRDQSVAYDSSTAYRQFAGLVTTATDRLCRSRPRGTHDVDKDAQFGIQKGASGAFGMCKNPKNIKPFFVKNGLFSCGFCACPNHIFLIRKAANRQYWHQKAKCHPP